MKLKSTLLGALFAGLIFVAPAKADMTPYTDMPAGEYTLDKTHAIFTWSVNHMGLSHYIGRFTDFDVDLDFDPANIENSKLTATVNPMSLATDYPYPEKEDFSKKLATSDKWLNAGEFSTIKFTATHIEKTGEKTGKVTGDLLFMGVTKPMTLDVTFNGAYEKKPFANVPALGFSAHGVIKRSEWGLSTYVPNIGDEVTLQIEAELHQEQESPSTH